MAQLFILLPVLEDDALLYAWRSAGSWQCAETYPESRFKGGEDAVARVHLPLVAFGHSDLDFLLPYLVKLIALRLTPNVRPRHSDRIFAT